ncbi:hypothetical protein CERZMDRAFT_90453 [Cercospora zeae-maydis SCOH1-5]|uniref:Uncharacterized protein n=1 Tax=Cercospora zeae-maydis SCOH1-5 TaxID=717836 RepID=A0A6A6FJ51_9PEZI|nr:hypothetical protein CERZMDRAFT_90453 [Cercospora zeae-maydis SCOH1-5]
MVSTPVGLLPYGGSFVCPYPSPYAVHVLREMETGHAGRTEVLSCHERFPEMSTYLHRYVQLRSGEREVCLPVKDTSVLPDALTGL